MNRIEKLFSTKQGNILSVYFTAGFPNLHDSKSIITALAEGGVEMIEIGIPFSDPMADGKVIQGSSQKALDNGFRQDILFEDIADIRKVTDIPLLFMGYVNTALSYGFENLCRKAAEIGVDGLVIPDLPFDEYVESYKAIVEKYGLKFIFLITPETSEERIRAIDNAASGFVYMVSTASTTGSTKGFSADTVAYFQRVSKMGLKNPVMVGFGISDKETFSAACANSRGAIIGSAFIKILEKENDPRKAVKILTEQIGFCQQ